MVRDLLSFWGKCLVAFLALIMFAVVGVLGLLAFILVDSVGVTPTKTAVTVVEAKQVAYGYFSIVPLPRYHPGSYHLVFEIDGEELDFTVDKEFFDDTNVGDEVEVDYGFGRLSGSHKPTRIRSVDGG